MMRAKAPIRSVGTLVIRGVGNDIDIKMYKKCENITGIGVKNHLYHEGCGGQIMRINRCVECGEEVILDDLERMADLGDAPIPALSTEEIRAIWGASEEARVVSAPSQEKFFKAIMEDEICLEVPYQVCPVDRFDERDLDMLLASLKTSGRVLVLEVTVRNQVRSGILLPNGTLYSLYFETEIRENRDRLSKTLKVDADKVELISKRLARKRQSVGKAIPKVDLEKVWDDLAGTG